MTPRPNQTRGVNETLAAIAEGRRRILLTSPTGGGKTLIMALLAQHYLVERRKVVLYTNRRMLLDQTSDVFMDLNMYHGVRAAGHADERDHPFQIASIQTEHSRSMKKKKWELHQAALVLVDEAHLQKEETARAILQRHFDAGAAIVGFTATPLDLGDLYSHLVVAGTASELRACGALVPAHHFAPDEPDIRSLKKKPPEGDNFSEAQQRQLMGAVGQDGSPNKQLAALYGRVWENFEKLNPERKPTILFAPGVRESIWFAEQFTNKGVPAAHIDGEDVWLDGVLQRSDRDVRRGILERSQDGSIRVLCNRFVLREGIDCPWLAHGIFATVFGSLQSYLQSGGRLLRSHPGKTSVTVQDHGGNWWRHGSLNDDREWFLEQTATMAYGLRAERIRAKKQAEPFRCPRCGHVWKAGKECKPAWGGCGFVLTSNKRSRPVATTEGTLREMVGGVFRPHPICQKPDGPTIWIRMWHRSRTVKGERTFRAAEVLFARENDWQWPNHNWPYMPTRERDWWLLVKDVPLERLTATHMTVAGGA